jgi:cytochrome subunit of sulfide dehydrogenase
MTDLQCLRRSPGAASRCTARFRGRTGGRSQPTGGVPASPARSATGPTPSGCARMPATSPLKPPQLPVLPPGRGRQAAWRGRDHRSGRRDARADPFLRRRRTAACRCQPGVHGRAASLTGGVYEETSVPASGGSYVGPRAVPDGRTGGCRCGTGCALLTTSCLTRHGIAATGNLSNLVGYPRGLLFTEMQMFSDGSRPATIIDRIAKGHTDEEFAMMADYFATIQQ